MQIQLCLENNIFQKDLFRKNTVKKCTMTRATEERQKEKCIYTYCSLGKVYEEMGPGAAGYVNMAFWLPC